MRINCLYFLTRECIFFGSDRMTCFRKYDESVGACKGRVLNRVVSDARACCEKHGQGYASQVRKGLCTNGMEVLENAHKPVR